MATVDAKITKVYRPEDSEWVTIELDDDEVDVLKTKMRAKATEAAAFWHAGERVRIKYTEKEGNINQYTGERFINRYYESAEPAPEVQPEIPIVSVPGRKTNPVDAWRMTLAKACELAIRQMAYMDEEQRRSGDTVKAVALMWR